MMALTPGQSPLRRDEDCNHRGRVSRLEQSPADVQRWEAAVFADTLQRRGQTGRDVLLGVWRTVSLCGIWWLSPGVEVLRRPWQNPFAWSGCSQRRACRAVADETIP